MALKEDDFVELEYTGKIVDDNIIFDSTLEEVAKKNNFHDPKAKYEPIRICLGKKQVIEGLDKNLIGKEVGQKYTFKIPPEDAFGQKNPKMIQLIATNKFKQQGINPVPGLQVNLDGALGMISRVSGGRTIVDFNHPLSGKELEYEVDVKRVITDVAEKVGATLKLVGVDFEKAVVGDKATIRSDKEIPKDLQEALTKAIKDNVPEIKAVSFESGTKKEDSPPKSNNKI